MGRRDEIELKSAEGGKGGREVRGGRRWRKCGIGDLGTLGPKHQRSRTHPSPQNVKLLVWKTHVAWVSANSRDQEGLKILKSGQGFFSIWWQRLVTV